MIENILANKTNHQIIRAMMREPNMWFSLSKLRTEIGCGVGSLYFGIKTLLLHKIIEKEAGKKILRVKISSNEISRKITDILKYDFEFVNGLDYSLYPILSDIVKILISKFDNIENIILYGSVARGRFREESDIDICVILLEKNPKKESEASIEINKLKRTINIIYFSKKEFQKLKKEEHLLTKSITEEGKSLIFA